MKDSIISERLFLSRLDLQDSSFILELVNTEGWLKFIGDRNVHSEAEAKDYIGRIMGNPAICYWVVRTRAHRTSIGIITLIKRDYLQSRDIGFAFLPGSEGQGYAFEATRAVLDSLHEEGDEREDILSITMPENVKSITLLKKLGFDFVRAIEVEDETLQVFALSNTVPAKDPTDENDVSAGVGK